MLEILYRIYEVKDPEKHLNNASTLGMWSISKDVSDEIVMTTCICDSREQFKEIIKDTYGDIPFRYSKKLKPGNQYCVIIGEHCYDLDKYFNKCEFECPNCGAKVITYVKPIMIKDYDIKFKLFSHQEYEHLRFCSESCRYDYVEKEHKRLMKDQNMEFDPNEWISIEQFTRDDIAGYIYKISKKSTGEFYIGQTVHLPIFRWGQHLKTDRFYHSNIDDYQFEVLEIVPKSKNILEVEKEYIQENYKRNPEKSLNISNTKNIDYREKLWE